MRDTNRSLTDGTDKGQHTGDQGCRCSYQERRGLRSVSSRSSLGPEPEGGMHQGPRMAGACDQADKEAQCAGCSCAFLRPEFVFLLRIRADRLEDKAFTPDSGSVQ